MSIGCSSGQMRTTKILLFYKKVKYRRQLQTIVYKSFSKTRDQQSSRLCNIHSIMTDMTKLFIEGHNQLPG